MPYTYQETVEAVFDSLLAKSKSALKEYNDTFALTKQDIAKLIGESLNNIIENACKYPLSLKQIELTEKQIEEADELLPEKKALAAAQVKKETAGAMLTIKQMLAYDDNIYVKYVEIEGSTIGMIDAGGGKVDESHWEHFSSSLNALKNRSMNDENRIAQLQKVVKDM